MLSLLLFRGYRAFFVAALFPLITCMLEAQTTTNLVQPAVSRRAPSLSDEQQQAVLNMTPDQISAWQLKMQPTIESLRNQIALRQSSQASFSDWQTYFTQAALSNPAPGNSISFTITGVTTAANVSIPRLGGSQVYANSVGGPGGGTGGGPPPRCAVSGGCGGPPGGIGTIFIPDLDQDGLPDAFETSVANNFTPSYASSAGEQQQFATFADSVPVSITSLVGTVPPYSYFRVQPLGLSQNGQLFVLRVDYLTLWNADGGLLGGGPACFYSYVGLDQVVQNLSGHYFDAERSGMYLAAPAVNGGYNPDPNAYSLYYLYTAAHENTFFNQSQVFQATPPIPAGSHVVLALSLSKHSTYTFNPDFYPITPSWFIDAYFQALSDLWAAGYLSDLDYYFGVGVGLDVFYGCLIERFSYQGSIPASQRVNVGEPDHPINGSTFIQDNSSRALNLSDKLRLPLF